MRHFKCKNCCLNLLCISIIGLKFFIMNLSDSTWIQTIIFQSINSRNFIFVYELWKFVYLSWTYDKVFISTALLLLHSIAWKKYHYLVQGPEREWWKIGGGLVKICKIAFEVTQKSLLQKRSINLMINLSLSCDNI